MNAKQLAQDSRFNQAFGFEEATCDGGYQNDRITFLSWLLHKSFDKSELRREIENDECLWRSWRLAIKEYKLSNWVQADLLDTRLLVRLMKYVYTCEEGFYNRLNYMLPNYQSISSFPFRNYTNLMMNQLKVYSNKIELYRGVSYKFKGLVGKKYFTSQFESCSTNKQVALSFLCSGGSLLIITTYKSILILDDSKFKYEKEHLIPPGISGKIKSMVNKKLGGYLH